jgi:predicted lipoprotein with Yx(FWY)xxD motif
VDASLLGTVERPDGSIQATYNGWPLYYFAGDPGAGDVNGQGVNDIWWVVSPAGEAISS